MFGMSESEYHFIMNTFVEPLKKEKLEVYFFGSCTRGENKKYSDLDIVLVNVGSRKTFVSELIEQIELSNFPYKIDVVFDEDLAESYRSNVESDMKKV